MEKVNRLKKKRQSYDHDVKSRSKTSGIERLILPFPDSWGLLQPCNQSKWEADI